MLPSASVKKPYTVAVIVVLVLMLGVISFTNMTTDLLPNINLPYILVITPYPGASPEKVELTVTRPVERTLSTMSGLKEISSVSQENSSTVVLQFEQGTNLDTAMIELSSALDRVAGAFEAGVSTPQLMRLSPDMLPVMALSVDADGMSLEELTKLVQDEVQPALERIDGVGSVTASGMLERRVTFTLDQAMIDTLNNRVLGAVDEELAEKKTELDDARGELEDGKDTLEREQEGRTKDLAEAGITLNEGIRQLEDSIAQIEKAIPEMEKQLDTLQEGYDGLVEAEGLYEQMITGREQLVTALRMRGQIEAFQSELTGGRYAAEYRSLYTAWDALADADPAKPAAYMALMQHLARMQDMLDMIVREADISLPSGLPSISTPMPPELMESAVAPAFGAALGLVLSEIPDESSLEELDKGIQEFDDTIRKQYETFREQAELLDLSLPDDTGFSTPQRMYELRAIMPRAEQRMRELLVEMPDTRTELSDTLNELLDKRIDLEQGRVTLISELAKAGATIDIAEQQLEQGEEAFEDAREQAYKQAGLDGVITKEMINSMLMAQNFAMPAGYIVEGEEPYMVKVGDQFGSVDELKTLVLFHTEVEAVGDILLTEVGVIEEKDNYDDLYARINGNDGILFTVMKQSIASTSDVCARLRETMAHLEETIPGLHLTALQDQGIYINIVTGNVLSNLAYGGILAILVLIVFLRDWRPTLITALSIPISLLFAVVLMYFSGVTLNIISLSGLALGVGMLVDNSIVAIENIFRLRNEGVAPLPAAVHGVKQISSALTSSTLTTVSVFAPIVFTEGMTREIFTDMGLTIAYSLAASLIMALTLVPAMGSVMLVSETKKPKKPKGTRILDTYERMLRWALRHRAIVLGSVTALLGVCVIIALNTGTRMFPEMESNQMSITIETGQGSTKEEIRAASREVEKLLYAIPDITTVGVMQNEISGSGQSMSMYALLSEKRTMENEAIEKYLLEGTEALNCELTVSYTALNMSAITGEGISLQVRGRNLDALNAIAAELTGLLEATEGVENVSDGSENSSTELRITVDKNKAIRYGLTTAQVFQELARALSTESTATTLTMGEEDYPLIVIKDEGLTRETIRGHIFTVEVDGEEETIRLRDIADIAEGESPAAIRHEGQSRIVTVTADIAEGYNIGLVSREFDRLLAAYTPPEGYTVEPVGENEEINQALEDVTYMILLAVAFIYLIMVAQFQSLLSPFIVMFTIPLAFTGGFLALVLCGFEISIIAMIGMLMLAGVVVNNGIVFVDTVNQLRMGGMSKHRALVKTGRLRIRPIMMTALTTILALVTMALGIGQGAELAQPLAIVTIGGLSYATVLTLFVVPVVYDLLHNKPIKKREIDEDMLITEEFEAIE